MATLQKLTTGRRKEAMARARVIPGSGQHRVNGRPIREYFQRPNLVRLVEEPLAAVHREGQVDILGTVRGGGTSGQAGALRMAVARALAAEDDALRSVLRKNGFLTRDSRMTERKKYGQAKARKRFQFSKR